MKDSPNLMRSFLFVPGNRPDRFEKAANSGADIFCIDLEDSVATSEKCEARSSALEFIAARQLSRPKTNTTHCFLRVNGLTTVYGLQDLLALACSTDLPDGIVLPMAASPFEIRQIVHILGHHSDLNIMPLIETPEGIENLQAIVRESDRVTSMGFGCADYAAATASDMSVDALLNARNSIIAAASSRKIHCFDGPWLDIKNQDGLCREATYVSRLGFRGKMAVHPSQVSVINETFMPSEQDFAWAKQVITEFGNANEAVVLVNGMMIDKPVIDQAKRILSYF